MAKEVFPVANDSTQVLDVTGVLREAIKLPFRNRKLMVSVTLLVLLPFSVLVLVHAVIAGPLLEKVEDFDDGFSSEPTDLRVLVCLEIPFLLVLCVLSLFGMATTIYSSSVTYTRRNNISLKELLLMVRATWKRLVITWLYVSLVTAVYIFLILVLIGTLALITMSNAIAAWSSLVGFSAALFYLYMASVYALGLVISVIEDDCYGMKALTKAEELIKGRKIQGFALMLLLELLCSPISFLFVLITTDDDLGAMTQMAFGSVVTVFFCIAKMFTFVVYTVLYYDCKKSHGETVQIVMGTGYSLVPTNLHVHTSLP